MSRKLPFPEVLALVTTRLEAAGIRRDHAVAMSEVIVAAEGDECHSHGFYRIEGCIAAIQSGKVRPHANPKVTGQDGAVVRVDADLGFAPLALQLGREALIETTRKHGIGLLAIRNCYHFSALWADIEPVVDAGLVALAFTLGHHCVALSDGLRPAIGTNPMAFGTPLGPGGGSFIFDQSVSRVARGEVELHRLSDRALPDGWAIDSQGQPTNDPQAALSGSLQAFGGHKGVTLGLMIELLAGPLLGDMSSAEALEIDTRDGGPLRGGYLMIAMDPEGMVPGGGNLSAAGRFIAGLTRDNPQSRLPAARRRRARTRSRSEGIPVPDHLLA